MVENRTPGATPPFHFFAGRGVKTALGGGGGVHRLILVKFHSTKYIFSLPYNFNFNHLFSPIHSLDCPLKDAIGVSEIFIKGTIGVSEIFIRGTVGKI